MRKTMWAVWLTMGLAGLSWAAADDAGYDLRGPAPKKGQVTVKKGTFKIKNASVALKIGGQELQAKQSVNSSDEEEITVLAVKDRQITKVQTKVRKDVAETSMALAGQPAMSEEKKGNLEGTVIISERTGPGKWKHALVDTEPTAKQKKDLDKRVGPESEDELYPAGKVKVGHTWTVEAAALQKVFGGAISDLKGKVKMKFVKVEMVDGQECAMIESAGSITGVAKEDDNTLAVEMQLKATSWRAIKTGVELRSKGEGKLKMSGKIEQGGQEIELSLEGPFTLDSTEKQK